MSGAQPRVAAVVLARDRAETTSRTLEAVLAQDPSPDALVLVGNDASAPVMNVLREMAARHPSAELVLLERNLGAAGGFHAGIAAAVARDVDYVCCFDDDARPLHGCLAALVATAERHPDAGCVGAVTHDGSSRLAWPLWIDGESRPVRTVEAVRELAARRGELTAVAFSWHGLLVPAAVVRRHGNVDAALFHQYEDAEFGLRLRSAGLRNYVATEAESVHPPAPSARELRIPTLEHPPDEGDAGEGVSVDPQRPRRAVPVRRTRASGWGRGR